MTESNIPIVVLQNQVTRQRFEVKLQDPHAKLLPANSYQIVDYALPEGTTFEDYTWHGLFAVYDDATQDIHLQTTAALTPLFTRRFAIQTPPNILVPSAAYAGQLLIPVRLVRKS